MTAGRFHYSARAWRLFNLGFGLRQRMGVRATLVAGSPTHPPRGLPLLLVANHVSWWDGFILREVQQKVRPGGALHIVMLEEELRKRPFLRRLGGVGLTPGSPASLRALLRDLTTQRETEPTLSVLFFPQGRIWPSHRRPLGFRGGVRLLGRALAPVTVLPTGLHMEGGNHMSPTAFVSFAPPLTVRGNELSPRELEEAVQQELDAIHAFLARHGEDTEHHWPAAETRLPRADNGAPRG